MALFTKGFQGIKDKVAKETEQNARRKFKELWWKKNEDPSKTVRFLDTEPVVFYEYSLENGRVRFLSASPDGDDYLGRLLSQRQGKIVRPNFQVGIPCLFRGSEEPHQVYIVKQGSRFGKKLDFYAERLAKKGLNLTSQDIIVTKVGAGTDTTWEFELEDAIPLSDAESKLELPDWEKYLTLPSKEDINRYFSSSSNSSGPREEESTPESFDEVDLDVHDLA